ncbi:MAG: acyl carrier protein, partial [Woeseiaceae bacterium]|nr:acyl carrier protein [Woeseiaceae bacterium]
YLKGDFSEHIRQLQNSAVEPDGSDHASSTLKHLLVITNEYSKDITINSDDDLFEVGISSLTLTEIMMAIDEIYPNTVQIEDVFEHPTLSKLAEFITIKKK